MPVMAESSHGEPETVVIKPQGNIRVVISEDTLESPEGAKLAPQVAVVSPRTVNIDVSESTEGTMEHLEGGEIKTDDEAPQGVPARHRQVYPNFGESSIGEVEVPEDFEGLTMGKRTLPDKYIDPMSACVLSYIRERHPEWTINPTGKSDGGFVMCQEMQTSHGKADVCIETSYDYEAHEHWLQVSTPTMTEKVIVMNSLYMNFSQADYLKELPDKVDRIMARARGHQDEMGSVDQHDPEKLQAQKLKH